MVQIMDVTGKLWWIKRSKCGHYYSKTERGKIFKRCKFTSIATVMGWSVDKAWRDKQLSQLRK